MIFADSVRRRISYSWGDGYQTSDGGSFYLDESGGMSFSGSLYQSVPVDSLTDTGETDTAGAWVFHHGYSDAGNGVDVTVTVRVYRCGFGCTKGVNVRT